MIPYIFCSAFVIILIILHIANILKLHRVIISDFLIFLAILFLYIVITLKMFFADKPYLGLSMIVNSIILINLFLNEQKITAQIKKDKKHKRNTGKEEEAQETEDI